MIKPLENPNGDKKQVVIVAMPWMENEMPLMAPAVLKSAVEAAGFSCLGVDINTEIKDHVTDCFKDNIKLVTNYFMQRESVPMEIETGLYEIFNTVADQILSFAPQWVGLSLLTWTCQQSSEILARCLRQKNPAVKIIIGGPGIIQGFNVDSVYGRNLLNQGIIDFYVHGDAEISLVQLLQGNTDYPGINNPNWRRLNNKEINSVPIPNYDDYNFDLPSMNILSIIGSRGCVRKCTYCDYIVNWDKYVWRTAENIFAEMLHHVRTYNINLFKFQDSLINGNQKEFLILLELLADYNEKNPNNQVHWSGMYIFREPTAQSAKEWELLSKSCVNLQVGIENFNKRIRYAMGKKFSNEAILYHLRHAAKHNILIWILMIIGYPDETIQEHQYNLQWLRDNREFVGSVAFRMTTGLVVLPNTYLGNNADQLGIKLDEKSHKAWVSEITGFDETARARWCLEMLETMKEIGFNYHVSDSDNHTFEQLLNTRIVTDPIYNLNRKNVIPIKQAVG